MNETEFAILITQIPIALGIFVGAIILERLRKDLVKILRELKDKK